MLHQEGTWAYSRSGSLAPDAWIAEPDSGSALILTLVSLFLSLNELFGHILFLIQILEDVDYGSLLDPLGSAWDTVASFRKLSPITCSNHCDRV